MAKQMTARGDAIDMDEMKANAQRALHPVVQPGSTIEKKVVSKRPPLNMRGHMAAQGKAVPTVPEGVKTAKADPERINPEAIPPKTSFTEDGEARSIADMTGIKVNQPAYVERMGGKVQRGDAQELENQATEALGDILSDLSDSNPNAETMHHLEEGDTAAAKHANKKVAKKRASKKKTTSE